MASEKKSPLPLQQRGLLARPLDALVFLIPLIVFYELFVHLRSGGAIFSSDRVIAFDLIRRFLEIFGPFGQWAPPLCVVVILLATHIASRESWSIRWKHVGLMYGESVLLAAPLLLLNWAIPLIMGLGGSSALDSIALGVGAGVYEELVFRLILISIVVMIGSDMLRLDRAGVAVVAVMLSALVFALHHHQPIGAEPFHLRPFLFRTVAGLYLAIVFWFRGYGSAAGCHAAYNIALVCVGSWLK